MTKYIHGKDLKTVINYSLEPNLKDIKTIIAGVATGIRECKEKNIIHRDIKPQNIVVDLDTMKPTIIDFGLAFNMKTDKGFNKCGTAAYMAP